MRSRAQGVRHMATVMWGLTCLSCSSEFTLTLQISQWKVRSSELASELGEAPGSPGARGPRRGYALMGPSPLRASWMVLCLVP